MKSRLKKVIKEVLKKRKIRIFLYILHIPIAYTYLLPSRLFDSNWYNTQRSADDNRLSGLGHYLLFGRRRGLTPNPFFVPEYFDNRNWKDSIIDPLLRYATQRSNWNQPTSILFSGNHVSPSKNKSPLVYFLENLSGTTIIKFDSFGTQEKTTTWADIKSAIYEDARMHGSQELLRDISRPKYSFDYKKESYTISRYREYDLGNVDASHPLVSIITPAWNRQDLIVAAVESAQAQTFIDWEMIIIDDGSTDGTVDVVKGLQTNDKRIKLLQPGHGGVCKARNAGLDRARGQWIAFLDSDNTWTPDFLQTMLAYAIENKYETGYAAIKMEGAGKVRYRSTLPDKSLLEIGNYIDLNALIVKKSILDDIGYFDDKLRRMVDYDLVCRISKVYDFCYVPIIGVRYTDHNDVERITNTELVSWDGVVKSKNFIEWDESGKKRNNSLTSIIIPVSNDIRSALRCLSSVKASLNESDKVEVIIADSASTMAVGLTLSQLTRMDDKFNYIRIPGSHDNTLGCNYGFSHSKGGKIIFLDQRMTVEKEWLAPLIKNTSSESAAIYGSLQLQPNGSISSAGLLFEGIHSTPIKFLEDHPQNDTRHLGVQYEVASLNNGCVSLSAATFSKLQGFNPLYDKGYEVEDFCLRARRDLKSDIRLLKSSIIVNLNPNKGLNSSSHKQFQQQWSHAVHYDGSNLWKKAGFMVTGYSAKNPANGKMSQLVPRLSLVKTDDRKNSQHRWAIKISAPADERRFAWGDMYYAQSLKRELEKLGQIVAIDYHGAHERSTSYLDDVILDLRGLDNVRPQAGKINIMWVISHPDKVSKQIVQSYDKVYAAGSKWAEFMSQKAGVDVEFLPQCTDPELFHSSPINSEYEGKVLFIGNSRGVMRRIVADSISAKLDVAVYGGGWSGLIDDKYIKGTFIPNDKLAEAYGSARVVLNDHWDDMRSWGFLSNRLFDATATGACVITDNIDSIDDIFKGLVRTYDTVEDIRRSVNNIDSEFPVPHERKGIASYVRERHSFNARAEELVSSVHELVTRANSH